jgi:hypothetical protein
VRGGIQLASAQASTAALQPWHSDGNGSTFGCYFGWFPSVGGAPPRTTPAALPPALQVPYQTDWANYLWAGVWASITYTGGLLMGISFSSSGGDEGYRLQMTQVRAGSGAAAAALAQSSAASAAPAAPHLPPP